MKKTILLLLISCLTSCVRQRHYYEVLTVTDLQRQPNDHAERFAQIQPDDTISATRRLKPNGQYELVQYKGYGGYVRSTGSNYLYSTRLKPVVDTDMETIAGFDVAYTSNRVIRGALIAKVGVNFFRLGFSGQDGGQKGKRVGEQLANYGRTITGSGQFLSSVDIGYGRAVVRNLIVEAEVSLGWRTYYTNYVDGRFNGGGYYLVNQTEFKPGVGLGARYFVNKYVNAFGGYNTLLGAYGGLGVTIDGLLR